MNLPRILTALILAPLLLLGASSSAAVQKAPGVVIASSPPGARVLVDGEDTGFVTPCNLGLPRSRARLQLVLPGYQVSEILLRPGGRTATLSWYDGMINYNTWHFPFWLNAYDFTSPVQHTLTMIPSRIFVPMRLAAN